MISQLTILWHVGWNFWHLVLQFTPYFSWVQGFNIVSLSIVIGCCTCFFFPLLLLNFLQFFGLAPRTTLFELETVGQQYCEGDWDKLRSQHHGIDEMDLLRYCFSSAYMLALLHDSLGIPMNDKRYCCSFCNLWIKLSAWTCI